MSSSNGSVSADAMVSDNSDLPARLEYFGFTADDVLVSRKIWEIISDEAVGIGQLQFEKWSALQKGAPPPSPQQREGAVQEMANDLQIKFTRFDNSVWVRSAEKVVLSAFAAGIPLTGIISIGSAYAATTLGIMSRRHECSKEERQQLNDVFIRMFSIECDIVSSIYTEYLDRQARQERDRLSEEFQRGVGLTVEEASEEGATLRDRALRSAKSTRQVLAKIAEVATAADQSATAMQGAAHAAAGLTRAIDEVRSEVETSAQVATTAASQAADAVGISEVLESHARSIESIAGHHPKDRGPNQLACAQCNDRGGARRGCRPRICSCRSGGEDPVQTDRTATDEIAAKISAIQLATRSTVETSAAIQATTLEAQESAKRILGVIKAEAQTVASIASAVDETALTADAMSNTITAIRENTEQVADEIDSVGHGFDQFGRRLGALRANAVEFAGKVAA